MVRLNLYLVQFCLLFYELFSGENLKLLTNFLIPFVRVIFNIVMQILVRAL